MIIPNIWKNKNVPNHQPEIGYFPLPYLMKPEGRTGDFYGKSSEKSWVAKSKWQMMVK